MHGEVKYAQISYRKVNPKGSFRTTHQVWPGGADLIDSPNAVGTACPGGQSGQPGIAFGSPTGYSNTSGGAFELVQLISTDSQANGAPGLDTKVPYPGPPTSDTPALPLGSAPTTTTRYFVANMFLMWQATGANTIMVPLGNQSWGFNGSATCASSCASNTSWAPSTTSAGPMGSFTPSSASQTGVRNNILVDGIPTWTSVTN